MSLVGLNIGTQDSLSAKTRRDADYYRQLADGTIKEVYDDETISLMPIFYQTNVEKVSFTKCRSIYDETFRGCKKLFFVDFPEVRQIGSACFRDTPSLTNIFFPEVLTVVINAFIGSGVETAELPKCTTLQPSVFQNCSELKEIKISLCKTIGATAFQNCSALEKIFLDGVTTVPTLATDSLTGTPEALKIIVPDALVDSFKVATNWSTYANKIIGLTEYEQTV